MKRQITLRVTFKGSIYKKIEVDCSDEDLLDEDFVENLFDENDRHNENQRLQQED